jgi:hypothetical protein
MVNNTAAYTTEAGAPGTCTGGTCVHDCIPTGCPDGSNCGTVEDGCGGTVTCGPEVCETAGQICGGGIPNQCGSGGDETCFEADGCTSGGCGPQSSCICTSELGGGGAAFCFQQICGAVCTSSADCVDENGVQYGRCSTNTGCCNDQGDCIAFANIEQCTVTPSFSEPQPVPPVDRS